MSDRYYDPQGVERFDTDHTPVFSSGAFNPSLWSRGETWNWKSERGWDASYDPHSSAQLGRLDPNRTWKTGWRYNPSYGGVAGPWGEGSRAAGEGAARGAWTTGQHMIYKPPQTWRGTTSAAWARGWGSSAQEQIDWRAYDLDPQYSRWLEATGKDQFEYLEDIIAAEEWMAGNMGGGSSSDLDALRAELAELRELLASSTSPYIDTSGSPQPVPGIEPGVPGPPQIGNPNLPPISDVQTGGLSPEEWIQQQAEWTALQADWAEQQEGWAEQQAGFTTAQQAWAAEQAELRDTWELEAINRLNEERETWNTQQEAALASQAAIYGQDSEAERLAWQEGRAADLAYYDAQLNQYNLERQEWQRTIEDLNQQYIQAQDEWKQRQEVERRDFEASLGQRYQTQWADQVRQVEQGYADLLAQAQTEAEAARLQQARQHELQLLDREANFNKQEQAWAERDRVYQDQIESLYSDLGLSRDQFNRFQAEWDAMYPENEWRRPPIQQQQQQVTVEPVAGIQPVGGIGGTGLIEPTYSTGSVTDGPRTIFDPRPQQGSGIISGGRQGSSNIIQPRPYEGSNLNQSQFGPYTYPGDTQPSVTVPMPFGGGTMEVPLNYDAILGNPLISDEIKEALFGELTEFAGGTQPIAQTEAPTEALTEAPTTYPDTYSEAIEQGIYNDPYAFSGDTYQGEDIEASRQQMYESWLAAKDEELIQMIDPITSAQGVQQDQVTVAQTEAPTAYPDNWKDAQKEGIWWPNKEGINYTNNQRVPEDDPRHYQNVVQANYEDWKERHPIEPEVSVPRGHWSGFDADGNMTGGYFDMDDFWEKLFGPKPTEAPAEAPAAYPDNWKDAEKEGIWHPSMEGIHYNPGRGAEEDDPDHFLNLAQKEYELWKIRNPISSVDPADTRQPIDTRQEGPAPEAGIGGIIIGPDGTWQTGHDAVNLPDTFDISYDEEDIPTYSKPPTPTDTADIWQAPEGYAATWQEAMEGGWRPQPGHRGDPAAVQTQYEEWATRQTTPAPEQPRDLNELLEIWQAEKAEAIKGQKFEGFDPPDPDVAHAGVMQDWYNPQTGESRQLTSGYTPQEGSGWVQKDPLTFEGTEPYDDVVAAQELWGDDYGQWLHERELDSIRDEFSGELELQQTALEDAEQTWQTQQQAWTDQQAAQQAAWDQEKLDLQADWQQQTESWKQYVADQERQQTAWQQQQAEQARQAQLDWRTQLQSSQAAWEAGSARDQANYQRQLELQQQNWTTQFAQQQSAQQALQTQQQQTWTDQFERQESLYDLKSDQQQRLWESKFDLQAQQSATARAEQQNVFQTQMSDAQQAWDAQSAIQAGHISELTGQIGGLQTTLAEQNAANRAWQEAANRNQELLIRDAERARTAASYGSQGAQLNPKVRGVRTNIRPRRARPWIGRGTTGAFNRGGMRIKSLNI